MALVPYDDRDGWIWMDGKLVPWRDAHVHFLTHGLHYGSAVFEGIRSYNGRIFKLAEHSQRLLDGCKLMDMKIVYSRDEIDHACREVLEANKLNNAYLRPLAWRGPEEMGVGAFSNKIHFGVAAWEWGNYFNAGDKGISLQTSRWRRPSPQCAPSSAKAAGLYMICTLAKHEATAAGFDDALMLDYRGYVAELSAANFFIVKNGEIHTPVPDCFLNGITRLTVMNEIAPSLGIKVVERVIMPEDLKDADECFATGTAAEITPVCKIDDIEYGPIGAVTRKVRDAFAALVRAPAVVAA